MTFFLLLEILSKHCDSFYGKYKHDLYFENNSVGRK